MYTYIVSTKIPREQRRLRKKVHPRKILLRWINRAKTKSCFKEKECYPVETYSTRIEAWTAVQAELCRIAQNHQDRLYELYYAWNYESHDWLY